MPQENFICYQIDEPLRNHWSKKNTNQNLVNFTLLGIQFCLKKRVYSNAADSTNQWNFRSEIKVRQIYANADNTILKVDDAVNPICKDNGTMYEMAQDNTSTDYHLHENTSLANENSVFNRLEYFDENTAYVYFSIDQVLFLLSHYDKIYLSGCQIDFGKKPSQSTPGSVHYEGPAFSLKLEGKEPSESEAILFSNRTDTSENVDEIAGVFVGAPCPPLWYAWTNFALSIPRITQIQPSDLSSLRNQFENTMDLPARVHPKTEA